MLGEQLVVVSDAHIRGTGGDAAPFLEFLAQLPALGDCLLINGDLFHFWFSYRRAIPQSGFAVAAALSELGRRLPIVMTGGNHDRWGSTFWDREAGIHFERDQLRFEAAGRTILATHGDALPEVRRTASLVRAAIAHPFTAGAFRLLHPDVGLWLVQRFGGRLADTTSDPTVLDAAQQRQAEWARQRLSADRSLGAVIVSHTHRTAVEELGPGRHYLNPGAWVVDRSYAVVTRSSVELRHFGAAPTPLGAA